MVIPPAPPTVSVSITGDTTGYVTGDPPNVATGDLDATVTISQPNLSVRSINWSISGTPSLGTATINPLTGEWTYTIDPAEYAALDPGDVTSDSFQVQVTVVSSNPGGGQLATTTAFQTITIGIEAPCFVAGTLIAGADKPVPVELLRPGDLVATLDRGLQQVRWVESARLDPERLRGSPDLWPVRISKEALGPGTPRRDLLVSQQHRMLVRGPQVELLFGTGEVLVAAKSLCHLPGIQIIEPSDALEYVHVLLDRHEILDAEGAPAESLFLGEEALNAMSSDGLQELASIFGQVPEAGKFSFGRAARMILRDREALALA